MNTNRTYRIGLLTLPLASASRIPLSNLVEILVSISKEFVLITGNEGYIEFNNENRFKVYSNNYVIDNSVWTILKYLYCQVKISLILVKTSKRIDYWVFFGGQRSVIAIIIAKLLNKKVIIVMVGSAIRDAEFSHDKYFKIIKILSTVCLELANKIILYSPGLISEWNLESYRHKILITHRHFLDFTKFRVTLPFYERPPLIGYIGRLSAEKGIENFVQALLTILNEHKDYRVLIGGDGPLKESITISLEAEKITGFVDLLGWISHDDLPKYLNQLQLLVLPSHTEGLPNILLEAMACGTPVLSTGVGAIPDLIIDGKTGFIMGENTPDCIARNVKRALNFPDLEKVAENGRHFTERNFTFDKTVEKWQRIFVEIESPEKGSAVKK
jgi:glycosyltransferase involved in cell wall biosynthesis